MTINSVNNTPQKSISFSAHTAKGNEFRKADAGFSVGTIAGVTVSGFNFFNAIRRGDFVALSKTETALKAGKTAAIMIACGIVCGVVQDFIINKIRKTKADKNQGTSQGKLNHALESRLYSKKYSPKTNAISIEFIRGKDFTSYQINADGTAYSIEGLTGKQSLITEKNEQYKKLYNIIKNKQNKIK